MIFAWCVYGSLVLLYGLRLITLGYCTVFAWSLCDFLLISLMCIWCLVLLYGFRFAVLGSCMVFVWLSLFLVWLYGVCLIFVFVWFLVRFYEYRLMLFRCCMTCVWCLYDYLVLCPWCLYGFRLMLVRLSFMVVRYSFDIPWHLNGVIAFVCDVRVFSDVYMIVVWCMFDVLVCFWCLNKFRLIFLVNGCLLPVPHFKTDFFPQGSL